MAAANINIPLGVALFGVGRAGAIPFRGILANRKLRLLYIIEEDCKKAEIFLKNEYLFESVKILSTAEMNEALTDTNVSISIICTPTFAHESLVKASINNGKHTFCEKPLAETNDKIGDCYDLASKMGVRLFCAFNRRHDASFMKIKEKVKQGIIGRVHMVKTCSRDSPVPTIEYLSTSGGVYHDCVIHDLDLICYVLDEIPISVFVKGACWDPKIAALNDHDTSIIILTFSSGTLGLIDISRHSQYGYDQRLEVHGDKGMLRSDIHPSDFVEDWNVSGKVSNNTYYSFPERYREAYQTELNLFVDCVMEPNKELSVTKFSTLLASKLADACEESKNTNKEINFKFSL